MEGAQHFTNPTTKDQSAEGTGRPDVNIGFVDASAVKDERDLSDHVGKNGDPFDPKRPKHGTFFNAWPKVWHLRRYTQQNGELRMGLSEEDKTMAKRLKKEYKDG